MSKVQNRGASTIRGNMKKSKYVVIINWGGGLHDKVIKVSLRDKMYDNNDEDVYLDHSKDILYKKDEERDGYLIRGFDSKSDAQLFLDGAKAFKKFLQQYIR